MIRSPFFTRKLTMPIKENFQNSYFQSSLQEQQKAFTEWQKSMRKLFSQQEKFMREQNEKLGRQFDEYRTRASAYELYSTKQPPSCAPYYPYGTTDEKDIKIDEKIIKIFKMLSTHISNKILLIALVSNIIAEFDPSVRISWIEDDDDTHINLIINQSSRYSRQYIIELNRKA